MSVNGVDGTPVKKEVGSTVCCAVGTESMPQDAVLMMACPVITSRITHDWDFNNMKCTQSTIITTAGVDGSPES